MPQSFDFRFLNLRDLKEVIAIENQVYQDPWTLELFASSLAAESTKTLGGFLGEKLAAYAVFQVILDEGHLLNLAIAPAEQRQGRGREFLEEIFTQMKRSGAKICYLEVRPSNLAARALYEKFSFRPLSVREK